MTIVRKIAVAFSALVLGHAAADAQARKYFPRYEEPNGGMVEFFEGVFYVSDFDENGMYSFTCKRLESMTKAIHWGLCEGGEKFLFTLDPEHLETMKIGDVVYKECGKLWDKC